MGKPQIVRCLSYLLFAVCGACLVGAVFIGHRRDRLAQPLRASVLRGDTARVHALLAQGADPNCWPDDRRFRNRLLDALDPHFHRHRPPHMTLLRLALEREHTAMACDLLNHGAMVTDGPELVDAIESLDSTDAPTFRGEIVHALLARGANINAVGLTGETPLRAAADFDDTLRDYHPELLSQNEDFVRRLAAAGADVNIPDVNGVTALMMAAQDGDVGVVQDLLHHGAHVGDRDFMLRSALTRADLSKPEVVKALLDHGANVNDHDTDDTSVLMCAVKDHCLAVVRLLLARDANVRAKNKDRKTALDYAADAQAYNKAQNPRMFPEEKLDAITALLRKAGKAAQQPQE